MRPIPPGWPTIWRPSRASESSAAISRTDPAQRVSRPSASRRRGAGPGFFINARTDLFLHSDPATHKSLLPEALERANAYAGAGADGFFVPGLGDEGLIASVCEASPLPVNIMAWPERTPSASRLAALGVARISHAGGPWRVAMSALEDAARDAQGGKAQ